MLEKNIFVFLVLLHFRMFEPKYILELLLFLFGFIYQNLGIFHPNIVEDSLWF